MSQRQVRAWSADSIRAAVDRLHADAAIGVSCDATGTNTMTETVAIDRPSVAKPVSRPRSRKPATVSASALALISIAAGPTSASSKPYPHSSENHQLLVKRKFDHKRRAAVIPIFCRYQAMVRLDNGACDGQSHAHAFGLAGEKRLEDLFQFVFGNARSAIRHG